MDKSFSETELRRKINAKNNDEYSLILETERVGMRDLLKTIIPSITKWEETWNKKELKELTEEDKALRNVLDQLKLWCGLKETYGRNHYFSKSSEEYSNEISHRNNVLKLLLEE